METSPFLNVPMPTRSSVAPLRVADVAALEALLGAPVTEWAPSGVPPFAKLHLDAGRTLFHEGAKVSAVYLLQAGAAKLVRTEDDGYEQVCEFVHAGDLIGVESILSSVHAHSVVALNPLTVWAVPLQSVNELRARFPAFDQQIKAQLCRRVARLEALVWQMSAIGAERRLARFIVRTIEEARAVGQSPCRIHLEMNRRDIASLLGLAHESISRALTSLSGRGLLAVCRRDLHVLDWHGIVEFAKCTRGVLADEPDAAARRPPTAQGTTPQPPSFWMQAA